MSHWRYLLFFFKIPNENHQRNPCIYRVIFLALQNYAYMENKFLLSIKSLPLTTIVPWSKGHSVILWLCCFCEFYAGTCINPRKVLVNSLSDLTFATGTLCKSMFAPALPELLWLPTVWRCPYIEIAFSTLDCSIVPTCGAWCSATDAKRGPLKQSWAGIQHSRDDEPLGVLMQMWNVRVNGFFFFLL